MLLDNPHWQQIKDEPGHFDVLDEGCIDLLHLNPETAEATIAHLNNDVPNEHKERFRRVAVRQMDMRWPFKVLWGRVRGRHLLKEIREAGEEGRVYEMTFCQPHGTY